MTKPTKSNSGDISVDDVNAQSLKDNPMLTRCFKELEEAYTKEWRDSAPDKQDHRENAYYMLRALHSLQVHVGEYINSGKIERSRVKGAVEGK